MAKRGLLCVSVAADNQEAILAALPPVLSMVDVVEIRLDGMIDPAIDQCLSHLAKPVLVTNRPGWEGGKWVGSEQDRINLLCAAVQSGAQYVDMELLTEPELQAQLLKTARAHGAQVIVSHHDFQCTPPHADLQETLRRMILSGADIGKMVTTAQTSEDALRLLCLQQEALAATFPFCAFAMGTPGKMSRLATLYLGGFMTYAALSEQQATAPGQLTVADLQVLTSFF
jgi:3-dehydroquinate dehydratase-1/3-dehydroquinate dehydratase/shikimate dehydrogenase